MTNLLGPTEPARKSASHGEAGYARNPYDAYFTEPWVTRALCQAIDFNLPGHETPQWIWEPACGDGRMAKVLSEFGYQVFATDIADHGYGHPGIDFLRTPAPDIIRFPAIVTNPPFGDLARDFTKDSGGKVAILQRHDFDAPKRNWPLFQPPYAAKLILPRRPRWSDEDKASPRFPYAWYIWDWWFQGSEPVIRFLDEPVAKAEALL